MSVSRSLALSAILGAVLLATLPAPAFAQVYDNARPRLDLAPDPIARSPRLLGMGQLTLAADPHNQLNFWDFAGNPLGILDADTTSTFTLRPATASSAGVGDEIDTGRDRQYAGSREARFGYEAWRRTDEGTVYGLAGDVSHLSISRTYDGSTELRGTFEAPYVLAAINGRMPYFSSDLLKYEMHASFRGESSLDEYRTLYRNAKGDFLGRESDILPPPNFFVPNEVRVSSLAIGSGLAYQVAPWLSAAGGFELSSNRVDEENVTLIHEYGTGADRSYYSWRAGASGQWGSGDRRAEYIYDVRSWTSDAETRWRFTLKAGLNQPPFAGRGAMLDRAEDGLHHRGRVRFLQGALELGASFDGWMREVTVTPPLPGDPESFNSFLNLAANREGADSLGLPDSIRASRVEESSWSTAFGATWKLRKGTVGVEYHYREASFEQEVAGEGPKRKAWDVRTGVEYPCAPALIGRAGYVFRSDDRDLFTLRNEFKSHILTLGLGLVPGGSIWGLDLGYAVEWLSPDFDDPAGSRESRQRLAAQLHWTF